MSNEGKVVKPSKTAKVTKQTKQTRPFQRVKTIKRGGMNKAKVIFRVQTDIGTKYLNFKRYNYEFNFSKPKPENVDTIQVGNFDPTFSIWILEYINGEYKFRSNLEHVDENGNKISMYMDTYNPPVLQNVEVRLWKQHNKSNQLFKFSKNGHIFHMIHDQKKHIIAIPSNSRNQYVVQSVSNETMKNFALNENISCISPYGNISKNIHVVRFKIRSTNKFINYNFDHVDKYEGGIYVDVSNDYSTWIIEYDKTYDCWFIKTYNKYLYKNHQQHAYMDVIDDSYNAKDIPLGLWHGNQKQSQMFQIYENNIYHIRDWFLIFSKIIFKDGKIRSISSHNESYNLSNENEIQIEIIK